MASIADFRLSITRALGDQLTQAILSLEPIELSSENIAKVEARGGVYQLFYDDTLVYTGKADRSLTDRLFNHQKKISGRIGIAAKNVTFVALYVDEDLSAVAPETMLIKSNRTRGESPWNFNGFGNKDPGRQRDTSAVKSDHFDALYPADLSLVCAWLESGDHKLFELLADLKKRLPFIFRFEGGNLTTNEQPSVYLHTLVRVEHDFPTVREVFIAIAKELPGWQITALPGYVIMYRESKSYLASKEIFEGPI